MPIRIFIADDHYIVREGIKIAVQEAPEIEIIGEAITGREVLEQVPMCRPDVLVLDVSLPELSGIEVAEKLLAQMPELVILVLTMHSDKRYIRKMLGMGVAGYVLKNAARRDILTAIKAVYDGKKYIAEDVVEVIVKDYSGKTQEEIQTGEETLTAREKEVLKFIADGKTTKEIAYDLNLSVKSIENCRTCIMTKLHIESIAGLVKYAIREGIISLED